MPSDPLPAHRLRSLVSSIRKTGFVAGATSLFEIERAAWDCFDHSTEAERLVAFSLAAVFGALARRQDEAAFEIDAAVKITNALSQPIAECADLLVSRKPEQEVMQALTRLADAHALVRNS